jgi:hypothetical protein
LRWSCIIVQEVIINNNLNANQYNEQWNRLLSFNSTLLNFYQYNINMEDINNSNNLY